MAERRYQTFKNEYQQQFKCIKRSSKGDQYAYCKYCRQDIKIAHGGAHDLQKHLQKLKHKENEYGYMYMFIIVQK